MSQDFGNYRTVSRLGDGGMGTVYAAEHPQIHSRVAVKVLHPHLATNSDFVNRFFNEARAANAIRHPNITKILDCGTSADGSPYLVMELLEGETVAARIKRVGPIPVGDAVWFAREAAQALGAAHDSGIVHRDLKPENIFIVPSQGERPETVKILDFGIAKLQPAAWNVPVQTQTGAQVGTPHYMSPEQWVSSKTIDRRTDVYALGLTLYEMLSGRLPFLADSLLELMTLHISTPPPPLSKLRPDLPAGLNELVMRALAKRPEDRFASMAELAAALDALELPVRPGGSTRAAPDRSVSSWRPTPSPTPRAGARARAVAIALAAAAVAGGAAVMTHLTSRSRTAPSASAAETDAGVPPIGAAPRPAPKTVGLTIDSRPRGALVVSSASGVLLGITPFTWQGHEGERLSLRLDKEGFLPRQVAVEAREGAVLPAVVLDKSPRLGHPQRRPSREEYDEPIHL